MGGVEPVDVQRRVGLGVAETLRVLENGIEVRPLVLHARKDVVACAVEDAVHGFDLVAGESFAQHADDRDAAAHGGAEVDVHVVLRGRVEDFAAMFGQQLLVGGDHALAGVERIEDERPGDARAADRLHDDPHVRIGDDGRRVRRQHAFRHGDAAVRRDVEVRDLLQDDVNAQPFGHQLPVAQKTLCHAGADRAESQYSYSDFLHGHSFLRTSGIPSAVLRANMIPHSARRVNHVQVRESSAC